MSTTVETRALEFAEKCRRYGAAAVDARPDALLLASPQWAARGAWGADLDLTREMHGLAQAARVSPGFACGLLADLLARAAAGWGEADGAESGPVGPTVILVAADVESFLVAKSVHATRVGDGYSVSGSGFVLGTQAVSPALALLECTGGGGVLLDLAAAGVSGSGPVGVGGVHSDPWQMTVENMPVEDSAVLQRLSASAMTRVRSLLTMASTAVIVGLCDARRPSIAAMLRSSTSGSPDRWVGQALKHRLADMAALREVAWLETLRAVDAGPTGARSYHAVVGMHEALEAAALTLDGFARSHRFRAKNDDRLVAATGCVSLLDTLAGGRPRLKDRVSDYVLDVLPRRPA